MPSSPAPAPASAGPAPCSWRAKAPMWSLPTASARACRGNRLRDPRPRAAAAEAARARCRPMTRRWRQRIARRRSTGMAASTSCTIMPARRWRAISRGRDRGLRPLLVAECARPFHGGPPRHAVMKAQSRASSSTPPRSSGVLYDREMIAYTTTKHAVIAMTRQMAGDYARFGIRVNALCPGWVDTPFNEPFIGADGRAGGDRKPMSRKRCRWVAGRMSPRSPNRSCSSSPTGHPT